MKPVFISLFIFISMPFTEAQTFQKTFGGERGDFGLSVQQTNDSGYILFGQTISEIGFLDMYLIKTDSQGNEQWEKTFGGVDWEFGISVKQTSDGGYVLCGGYSGPDNDSLALLKTDSDGNLIWNKRYSGSTSRDGGQFVQETADGGFIAVGFTGTGFTEDIYLVRTDNNGNEIWNKVYLDDGRQFGVGICETADGGFIITGETDSHGFGGSDLFLMKTNSLGDTSWTETFGTEANEIGRSIYITSDGGYILLGYENFIGGNLFLVKTDISGNEQWHKYYGGNGWDMGHSVEQTADGGYVLAGRKENIQASTNDMYCIKTDNFGIIEWEQTYPKGIISDANSVQQTSDGGYILFGSTTATDDIGNFNTDMYLVKVASDGLLNINNGSSFTERIAVNPNPFHEFTSIQFDNLKNEIHALNIFNCQGQLIHLIENIKGNEIRIDRSALLNGIYFFQLTSKNSCIATGKFIVN